MENNFIEHIKNTRELNKLIFLDDCNFAEITKKQYFNILAGETIINTLELSKGKDLYDFTLEELTNLIINYPTTNTDTKYFVKSIISRYFDYAINRGLITTGINLADLIDKKYLATSKNILEKNYMRLKDFYSYVNSLKATSNVDIMILVLLRYGVYRRRDCKCT